jgi:branched-chain amino acid transport system substrate-binding protein
MLKITCTCITVVTLWAAATATAVELSDKALAEDSKSIKVGVIAGMTGLAAPAGIGVRNGITLADSEVDRDNQVEFIFEDDSFQPKNAVSAAQKLITEDKVSALITFSASTSLAVAAVAEARGVPTLAITPFTSVGAGKRSVRTIFVPNKTAIALLHKTVMEQHGTRRVAILTSTQDGLLQMREQFRASTGFEVVFDEEIRPGDLDLLSTVTRLLASKPDVVVNLTLPPQVSHVARLLRDHRFTGRHLGAPPMYNYSEIKAAAGALTGANLTGPRVAAEIRFFSDYTARFSQAALPEAMFGYDAATWIIEAQRQPARLHSILAASSMRGLAGEYSISPDNQFEVPGELKVITASGAIERALALP